MTTYEVAVLPGDGIGPEIMAPTLAAMTAVAQKFGFALRWAEYDWGSDRYRRTGAMMPVDALEQLERHDALLFGAVGVPDIPDVVTLWGLLIPIRRGFRQYINLRPVRYIDTVNSPLAQPGGIDIVVVRENVEGEYSQVGGRAGIGADEYAIQEACFTRKGVARVARYAAQLATRRSGNLVSATKSNGIVFTMPFWDEVVAEVVAGFDNLRFRPVLIDALAAQLVRAPQDFDVIVASNLFGDILSDLTGALVGSLGLAASGNLNPERSYPSMFEPVHGSAPDIAGRGVANPMAQIYAGAMLLDHLGQVEAAAALTGAVDAVLRAGVHTPDLGGSATTADVSKAVLAQLA